MKRSLSIAWRLLVNLVTGATILAMYSRTNSRFETIVVSALVLIYVVVTRSSKFLNYAIAKRWNLDTERYIAIAKSLHMNTETAEAAQKDNKEEERKADTAFFITASFNAIFALIAIGYLLDAIAS